MKDKNFLSYIPVKNPEFPWYASEENKVVLKVKHDGFFDKIAQKFFKRPKESMIHFDEMGSFIWPLIDGKRSISDIADMVKEEFGEKANPLYPRLIKFFQILHAQRYISFLKEGQDAVVADSSHDTSDCGDNGRDLSCGDNNESE